MSNAEPAAILRKMRTLLALGWCRRALARRGNGTPCHPYDALAASWSLHGACMRAAYDLDLDLTFPYVRDTLREYIWDHHHLYYMWCDDSPHFNARNALDTVETLLHKHTLT